MRILGAEEERKGSPKSLKTIAGGLPLKIEIVGGKVPSGGKKICCGAQPRRKGVKTAWNKRTNGKLNQKKERTARRSLTKGEKTLSEEGGGGEEGSY